MAQIELKNITKIFKGDSINVTALKDIDLLVEKGDFVAILGPSGSGKSTLMHVIGALTKISKGSYILNGDEVSSLSDKKLAEIRKDKIGFVFQSFNLVPRINVIKNVELPMIYAGVSLKNRQKKALELLEMVNLKERANFRVSQLSGGETQRVAIARALANNPDIILADEPTGNLDSKNGEEVMEIFKDLNKKGITILLVTHDNNLAKNARRIVKLRDGLLEAIENVS